MPGSETGDVVDDGGCGHGAYEAGNEGRDEVSGGGRVSVIVNVMQVTKTVKSPETQAVCGLGMCVPRK